MPSSPNALADRPCAPSHGGPARRDGLRAMRPRPPRVPATRRALVGLVWALAWMVAWAGAVALFAHRTHARGPALAVPAGPDTAPVCVADARAGRGLHAVACRGGA
jgi:hypothetical protein